MRSRCAVARSLAVIAPFILAMTLSQAAPAQSAPRPAQPRPAGTSSLANLRPHANASQPVVATPALSEQYAGPVASAAYTIASPSAASQIGNWVWLSGNDQFNQHPAFGTLQVPSTITNPGSTAGAAYWTDDSGNLWLFDGDVWEFNSTTLEWTWMVGSVYGGPQYGVYGTLGSPSPNNVPGARGGQVTWKDKNGNFWLFGGEGYATAGTYGYLNDLWMFSPSTLEWTWMGGSNVLPTCPSTNSCGPPGVYGTLGTPSTNNVPSGRSEALGWTDANGDFWLFGGRIYIVYLNGWGGYENDLWKYSPSTNEWAWMGGNSSLPFNCTLNDSCGYAGIYGTPLTPSTSNLPGAREDSTTWTDSSGNFWLLGGFGYDSAHIRGYLNDLWKFDPAAGTWEWVSGSNTVGAETYDGPAGVYGTKGSASLTNVPGGREDAASWVDQANDLWLFGGIGYGSDNSNGIFSSGYLNDLWEFNPRTNEWTWTTGSDLVGGIAAWGTFDVAAPANDPGNRTGVAAWSDKFENLWFFGGYYDVNNNQNGDLSDVWEYLLNGPAHQTITFVAPSQEYYGVSPITLSATGGASGNPVVFSLVSGPGSLSGANNHTLTITGVGTIVIAANQAGSSNYLAATQVTQSITALRPVPAALTTPAPGSTLSGTSATFTWTAGGGVTKYEFRLGTTGPGSKDVYNSADKTTTSLSTGVIPVPAYGVTLYARLYSFFNGVAQYNDYTYTESGSPVPAALTSPTPGSTLGTSATFGWTAGGGISKYEFRLGTTGVGSKDIYNASDKTTTALSTGVISVPAYGITVYARLYSFTNTGASQYKDYTYTESGTPVLAVLTSPAPGSRLTGSSATFSWTAGGGVTKYEFRLGTTGPGSSDVYNAAEASTTALTTGVVSNIPLNGATLYARLYSYINGAYQHIDYTYTETLPPAPAVLTSPTPGSTLPGTSATFTWTPGGSVSYYEFRLGTTGAGSKDVYNAADVTTTALTTGAIPVPAYGVTLYARLYSTINGVTQYNDYTYTESGTPVKAVLTSPTPGTTLTGSSATFNWTAGGGVTKYEFRLGTTGPGSNNVYNSTNASTAALTTGSVTVPTTGATLYARLYSYINGAWQYTDYTYTEQESSGAESCFSF